jgi:hypothetical protein
MKGSLITENNFVQKQIVLFKAIQHNSTKVADVVSTGLKLLQQLKCGWLERQSLTVM